MKLNILFLTLNDITVLEFIAYSLQESLPGTSIDISEASYAKDAMKILESKRIDLIIGDMNIDTLESYEFYDNLQLFDEYKDIPFVFLSSNEEDQEIAFLKGISNFFLKPLDVDQLLETLHNILKDSKTSRDIENNVDKNNFIENSHLEIIEHNLNQIEELMQNSLDENKEKVKELTSIIKKEIKKLSFIDQEIDYSLY